MHEQGTPPLQVQHALRHHHPAQQGDELQAANGDERDHHMPQRMFHHHHALEQPLGTRGPDVIIHQDIQERGARHPGDEGDLKIAQRHGGPEHLAQIPPDIVPWVHPDEFGGPGEDTHQAQQQQHAPPEDRHRQARDAEDAADVVQPGSTPDPTEGAQRDPDEDGDRHRVHRQIDRHRVMLDDQVLDGLVGDEA